MSYPYCTAVCILIREESLQGTHKAFSCLVFNLQYTSPSRHVWCPSAWSMIQDYLAYKKTPPP